MRTLAFLFIAATCFAQQPFELHGVVMEPGVGPISGVEIHVSRRDRTVPNALVTELPTVFTDGRGEFLVRVPSAGLYFVYPTSPTYLATPGMVTGKDVDLSHPRAEFSFGLSRLGEIIGRVVDADTLAPIPGVRLTTIQHGLTWLPAGLSPLPLTEKPSLNEDLAKLDMSGPDGAFTLTRRRPGDYAVTAASDRPAMTIGYSPEALDVIEQAYAPLYWPGGVALQDVAPMSLRSGGVINIGTIAIKKAPVYRIHIAIPQGDCPGGESVRVSLFGRLDTTPVLVAPCGSDLLATHLQPGPYVLYAVSDWQGERDNVERAVWASAQVVIEDKNVEAELDLRRGIVLEGRVTSAEDGPPIPDTFSIVTQPDPLSSGLPGPPPEQFIQYIEPGRFRVAAGPYPQTLSGGGRDVYIKEARYNGAPARDLKLPLNAGSTVHSLELILDDRFGAVRGEVTGSGVVVFQSEATRRNVYMAPISNGSFVSPPLPPGRYRIAVQPVDQTDQLIVSVFDGAPADLTNAQTITVRPGATETLNLRR